MNILFAQNALRFLILLILPPLLPGIITKTKAWFAGRTGAPLLQPYYDIAKLARRGIVLSSTVTWIFIAGPLVTLAAAFVAGLMIPMGTASAPLGFAGDFILLAYLFGLARFFTTAAALDTSSAFEGMGSAREVTFAVLSEPATFLAFLVLAKCSGTLTLNTMLGPTTTLATGPSATLALIAFGLFIVLLAETCRIPVDDPTTHLELTMIHEAMVLDHSGPLMAIVSYAAAMKMLVLGTLVIHIINPFTVANVWAMFAIYVAELFVLAVVIGIVESVMARLRMRRVPQLLGAALFACALGFILVVRS